MKHIKIFLCLLVSLVLAGYSCPLWAQVYPDVGAGIESPEFERVGSAGFQFLKLPTNARMAAMGGVMSSLSHGTASAALANPASLAEVENISVHFSQMNWIADIKYTNAAAVKNFGEWGNFGLSFIYVNYGDMIRSEISPIYDAGGKFTNEYDYNYDIGTFSAHDLAFGVSYGRKVTDRLQFGANLKYVQEKIDDASSNAFGLDIGTVYYTGLKTFRIAALGRNFGPDSEFLKWADRIAFESAKVKMPMTFVLGGAIDILEGGDQSPFIWTVAAEFVHTNDAAEKVNFGTEFSIMNLIVARAGYRFNYDEEGITAGAGMNLHLGSYGFCFNYAYVDFGRLDNAQMFSLLFKL